MKATLTAVLVTLLTLFGAGAAQIEVLETTGEYRLIQHALAETRVPLEPGRIVALQDSFIDALLALDVAPVGVAAAYQGGTFASYLEPHLGGAQQVGYYLEPNLEAILALEPDLILAGGEEQVGLYEQFARIAPTVFFEDPYAPSEQVLRAVATTLGIPERADARLARFETLVADAKRKLREAIGSDTVAILRVFANSYGVSGRDYTTSVLLYEQLGLEPAAIVPDGDSASTLSFELLPELDADHIFVVANPGSEAEALLAELQSHPLWQTLPAAKAGNIYPASWDTWTSSGVLSDERKVDDVLGALTAANASNRAR